MDYSDFKAGYEAAMQSVWDRLSMHSLAFEPMDAREVEKLLNYVRSNLPVIFMPNVEMSCSPP